MSDIAINLLGHLRHKGVEDAAALNIAQSLDRQMEEVLREAKAHADRHRAETDEKIKANAEQVKAHAEQAKAQAEVFKAREDRIRAEFVSASAYHERDKTLATREDLTQLRVELRAEIAEIRKDNRHTQRLILGGIITIVAALIGGFSAIIAKLYFGV